MGVDTSSVSLITYAYATLTGANTNMRLSVDLRQAAQDHEESLTEVRLSVYLRQAAVQILSTRSLAVERWAQGRDWALADRLQPKRR